MWDETCQILENIWVMEAWQYNTWPAPTQDQEIWETCYKKQNHMKYNETKTMTKILVSIT